MCQGTEFKLAARMRAFLHFVVNEHLEGRGDQLKAYTVGLSVYERDASFDPNTDPIVRVDARRLRRKLLAHYAAEGADEPFRIELPKGSYSPRIRPVHKATQSGSTTRNVDAAPVVAVLPLQNLSSDANDQFFCDGMTEEIITELARYTHISVVGRHSSFRYKGDSGDIRAIATDLHADYVVEGSVRRGQSKVRVTIQLIEGMSGRHVWAESYTRDHTAQDVIDIQDDITGAVAVAIAEPYGIIPSLLAVEASERSSESLSAYEWVLRFYEYWAEPLPERYAELCVQLPAAGELDPKNASIHAAYSLVCTDAVRFFRDASKSEQDWMDESHRRARRAVDIDSRSALTLQALAACAFHTGDIDLFRKAAQQAVKHNPNHANLLADLAALYTCIGEWDHAAPMAEHAIRLSPHHPNWYHVVPCMHAMINGDHDTALRHASLQVTPGLILTEVGTAAVYGLLGRHEQAAEAAGRIIAARPDFRNEFQDEMRLWNMCDEIQAIYRDGLAAVGLVV